MKSAKSAVFQYYLHSLFAVLTVSHLLDILQYRTTRAFLLFLPICALFLLTGWGAWKQLGQSLTPCKERYPGEQQDRLRKRTLNLTFLAAYALFVLFSNCYLAIAAEVTRSSELLNRLRPSVDALLAVLFLLYAAVLQLKQRGFEQRFLQYWRWEAALCLGYWGIYAGLVLYFRRDALKDFFAILSAVYLALGIAATFTLRKKITVRNISWKKRNVAIIVSAVFLVAAVIFMRRDTYYLQGYINLLPQVQHNTAPITYREEDGVYEIQMEREDFRILQLTDIHFGDSITSIDKDFLALQSVYTLIVATKPDLVIVTGDMTYPIGIASMSFNNSAPVSQFAAFMRNLNIPWAFTFGNHDTEAVASLSQQDLCGLYRSLSYKTTGTLLYPYVQPNITGRNNQLIELYNKDGSLNQALFLIDSNAYLTGKLNDYDYIHDDQVDWYAAQVERLNRQEGKTVSSLAFFHIPLQQYLEAYNLYEAGSDEVTYFFGSNDETIGGKVCCSKYPSRFFDKMLELGSTKATFCGHDHFNNMSLEYKGIRLTYGMSIDYLATPGTAKSTKQRGGTLITVAPDSSFTIEQVPLTSVS